MGAHGVGVYDNDGAADWTYGLKEGGVVYIEESLQEALQGGYFEGDAVLAAADVVARLRAGGGEQSAYCSEVVEFVEAFTGDEFERLIPSAILALDRLVDAEDSESYQLWEESGSLSEWLAVVAEVKDRLTKVL